VVASRTARGALSGALFVSPCLSLKIPDQFEVDVV